MLVDSERWSLHGGLRRCLGITLPLDLVTVGNDRLKRPILFAAARIPKADRKRRDVHAGAGRSPQKTQHQKHFYTFSIRCTFLAHLLKRLGSIRILPQSVSGRDGSTSIFHFTLTADLKARLQCWIYS